MSKARDNRATALPLVDPKELCFTFFVAARLSSGFGSWDLGFQDPGIQESNYTTQSWDAGPPAEGLGLGGQKLWQ